MGGSCGCDLTCKTSNMFNPEFSLKPVKASLKGTLKSEEPFIISNQILHNSNFSQIFFQSKSKPRPQSAFANIRISRQSNAETISAFKSLQYHLKSFNEDLTYEGELEKYTPGMTQKFTSRWGRLNHEGFSYYKNQWAAASFAKPLRFFPLSTIKKIKVVKNRIQKQNPEIFEFEVCLFTDDEESRRITKRERKLSESPDEKKETSTNWNSIRIGEVFNPEKKIIFGVKNYSKFAAWVKHFEKVLRNA